MRIVKIWMKQGALVQAITFATLMFILLPLYAAEMVVTTSGAFMAAVAAAVTWVYLKKRFSATLKTIKTVE